MPPDREPADLPPDPAGVQIGGRPVVTLTSAASAGVVRAEIAPGRGMLLLQAVRRDVAGAEHDLLDGPNLAEATLRLDGGADDFAGNAAFSFGGAILLPYAGRIPGRALSDRDIQVDLGDQTARLPHNGGGHEPGAVPYALHGLILDLAFDDVHQPASDTVTGVVRDHDFRGRWPSRADIAVTWRLSGGGLGLEVQVTNVGDEVLPLGIGWHPWFRLPSGQRDQVRLSIPAGSRAAVTNYDEVLPTGQLLPVGGSAYDVAAAGGLVLGELHLDDAYTDLSPGLDGLLAELIDPAGGLSLRLFADAPPIRAVQVYAPADRAVIALEPQFNLADPLGALWPPGLDTGMVRLKPGESSRYRVRVEV